MENKVWTSDVFDSVKGKLPATPSKKFEERLQQALENERKITRPNIIHMKWMAAAACAILVLISINFLAIENWNTKNENQSANTQKNYTADILIPNYDFLNESL